MLLFAVCKSSSQKISLESSGKDTKSSIDGLAVVLMDYNRQCPLIGENILENMPRKHS